jgi:DNA-binding response OmpR family regulator
LSSEKPLLLLVEDEALLALPLETELADAGFEVVLASSGEDAISQIELDAVRFSGLITDIRLPHVDGWTIAKRARELVPTIPVVYMSGDSAGDWSAYGVPDSVMLAKPFAAAQLITAIANLINQVPVQPQAPDVEPGRDS